MLILTRRCGEGFSIGPDIHVKILREEKGFISVGINAPKSVVVLRDEVLRRKIREMQVIQEDIWQS